MQKTIPKNTNNKKANRAQKDGQGMKVQKSQMDLHINESSVMDAGYLSVDKFGFGMAFASHTGRSR